MNTKLKISCVILTYNEELHLERALINALQYFEEVVVLDSGSNDNTLEISKSYNVPVFFNKFLNYSSQRNFFLMPMSILMKNYLLALIPSFNQESHMTDII